MSNYNDIETMMEILVKRTEKIVNEAYSCHKEGKSTRVSKMTSVVFPLYSTDEEDKKVNKKNKTRISEQELRFAFVQVFQEYKCKHHTNYLYGIEVPTKDKYLFTIEEEEEDENGNKKKKRKYKPRIDKENGRSGSFDMVIFNEKLERVCLIEFKYNHPEKGSFAKDFLKLANLAEGEEKIKRYFIHLMKDKASDEENIKKNARDGLSVSIESVIYKPVILKSKYQQ